MTTALLDTSTQSRSLFCRLHEHIQGILAVDCHDHVLPRQAVLESGDALFHVFASSCLDQGMEGEDGDPPAPPYDPAKSWDALRHRLPGLINTGPYQCLVKAAKLLYDFADFPLDEQRYHELRNRVETAYKSEDWYIQALKEKARIESVIWAPQDSAHCPTLDGDLFLPVPNLDDFVRAYLPYCKARLEEKYHVKLLGFEDVEDLLGEVLLDFDEEGVPAFWLSYCRFRPLRVDGASSQDVGVAFRKSPEEISPEEAKRFQDYMIHRIADRCGALNVPLQIDTGTPSGALLTEHSDPSQATGLVAEHWATRFAFLHTAPPFARYLGALAKTFRNIYADGSFLAGHSPSAFGEVSGEWLELLPVAKILFWGGNAACIEHSIGSLLFARETLCRVLCDRVENGFFTEELAFDLAGKLLRDVPRRFFKTDEVRVRRQVRDDP